MSARSILACDANNGYIEVANSELIQATIAILRMREGKTDFEWIKGHNGNAGNEEADQLANQGAHKPSNGPTDIRIPRDFRLSGAKIATATQALMYKGIRIQKSAKNEPQQNTVNNLKSAQVAAGEVNGTRPTDERLWKAISRNPNIPHNIQAFLWKSMHRALKCGAYWTNIPKYEDRAECTTCNSIETLEHILFHYPSNHGELVWKLAKEMCALKEIEWPKDFYLGHILSSGTAKLKDKKGKHRIGASRLYTIVITECAFVIWKIRNEQKISQGPDEPDKEISESEAKNRTIAALNTRLTVDRLSITLGTLCKKTICKKKNTRNVGRYA